jgi:2-keto-4-pentenoate hydratase/2-oxohepta-3-ene-1,7-dioic acid hydratase in catechol pathway
LRLATIRRGDTEEAAVALPDGLVPVGQAGGLFADDKIDLLSLLESGRYYELKEAYDRGELLRGRTPSRHPYAPLYRRPRKIWGLGPNYVEHAEELGEVSPSEEPASFMMPDTTIIGPGDEVVLPAQSERITAEAELAVIIAREAKDVSEGDAPRWSQGSPQCWT